MKSSVAVVGSMLVAGLLSASGCLCASAPSSTHECCCSPCACEGSCSCIGGRWAFSLNGGACWMGVVKNPDGTWSVSILWGGGSPIRQASAVYENGVLTMRQKQGSTTRETIAKADGDKVKLTIRTFDKDGKLKQELSADGWRIPAVPPAPDLSAVKYGEPINLLSDGLDGWKAMGDPSRHNGWSFKDGVLSNRIARKPDGKPVRGDANLQTKRADFEDFRISYDVRVLPECNSGLYLRGIYELQVLDSYGRPLDCHNMAAFSGRITPSASAEKPANEWQHVDAILCDRHVTVVLNGVKIIDNQPVLGVTGGAITSDEFIPGPIYLQGDHSDADFRNIILTPILKKLR